MRIYLDHAATSFPKRPGVVEAQVARPEERIGGNGGGERQDGERRE